MILNTTPPPNWGSDEITRYIDVARNNSIATFVHKVSAYSTVSGISTIFEKLNTDHRDPESINAVLFLLRAHSAYLASVSLGMSGQLCEAYAVMRLCIENALYGHYVHMNSDVMEVWLSRHESEDNMKKVRDVFTIKNVMGSFHDKDERMANAIQTLYERTIDMGGHPNERGLMQTLKIKKVEGNTEYTSDYLAGDGPPLDLCLKSVAQVGGGVLFIFRHIFPERFEQVDVNRTLEGLAQNL